MKEYTLKWSDFLNETDSQCAQWRNILDKYIEINKQLDKLQKEVQEYIKKYPKK